MGSIGVATFKTGFLTGIAFSEVPAWNLNPAPNWVYLPQTGFEMHGAPV